VHIVDGVLSNQVVAVETVAAAAGVGIGLRRLHHEDVPKAGMLAAVFYVASLVHVPAPGGVTSVHLVLSGLAGIMLGWGAFPTLLTALFLQYLVFRFGGITTLGVNTLNMALPCVLGWLVFRRLPIRRLSRGMLFVAASLTGGFAVLGGAFLTGLSLLASGQEFRAIFVMVIIAHVPVVVVDGLVTGAVVLFLSQVKPELLACDDADKDLRGVRT
jgi:cobalt/nickel transport system permease protein